MTDKKARENEMFQPRGINEVRQAPGVNEAFIRTDIPHIPGMIIHVTNDTPLAVFRSEEKEE